MTLLCKVLCSTTRQVLTHCYEIKQFDKKSSIANSIDLEKQRLNKTSVYKNKAISNIKAEKSKEIRELTDPDHAWEAIPEDNLVAESPNLVVAEYGLDPKNFVEHKCLYEYSSVNPDDLAAYCSRLAHL